MNDWIEHAQESVGRYLGVSPEILEKLGWTIVVLLVLVVLQRVLMAAFTRRFAVAERLAQLYPEGHFVVAMRPFAPWASSVAGV